VITVKEIREKVDVEDSVFVKCHPECGFKATTRAIEYNCNFCGRPLVEPPAGADKTQKTVVRYREIDAEEQHKE